MKAIIIIVVFALLPLFSFGQSAQENGTSFIQKFLSKNFEDAFTYFDESVKGQITLEFLKETENTLGQQIGDFKKTLEVNEEEEGPYKALYYYSEFEKMNLDIKLVFNDKNKIVGFFFLPHKEISKNQKNPDYNILSENISLPGTLLIADRNNQKKLVILIHGSGPNDRDETILENKPFRDIAEGLLRHGISSYRFDKRTKVAPSLCIRPDFNIDDEVTNDVVNIIHYFHKNDTFKLYKIYIIGHSLGAMMSPRIALKAGNDLSGVVMLAAPARSLDKSLLEQYEYIYSLKPSKELDAEVKKVKKQIHYLNSANFTISSPKDSLPLNVDAAYWKSIKDYNQVKEIEKVHIPVLILQGEKDYQVTMKDYSLWKNATKNNPKISMKSYPVLNHIFMENKGIPSPDAYKIKQNIPSFVIDDIATWIINH
jgi:hypothetical protein